MRYSQKSSPSRSGRKILLVIIFCALAVGSVVVYLALNQSSNDEANDSLNNTTRQQPNGGQQDQPSSVRGKYLLTGTIVPARGVEQYARDATGEIDYQQPFSQLHTLSPDSYDAWMTDLECPITDANLTFRQQVDTLVFNCRPGFIDPITSYFEIINLANNHSSDQGQQAFVETQEQLVEAGAQIFGHYNPSEKTDTCEVIALPVRLELADGSEQDERLPVAFCAWHYFQRGPAPGELAVIDEYVDVMPVFAFTHAGAEYVAEAQPAEVALTRSIIDKGAAFVINNNPHWVQNTEVYKDRLIVYSTGNFIFDQLDEETNRAANIDVEVSVDYSDNVQQWLEMSESCLDRNDDCVAQARSAGLSKIDLHYRFDVIASLNGYQEITQKADRATQEAIEARMNWQQTLKELGQTN